MLCFTATSGQARPHYDRHVTVINESSRSIVEFYASNEDTNSWEEDILGKTILPPGHRVRINVDDGTGHCVFDFKAVMRGGAKVIRRGVNVCRVGTWTITD
jgi:hypothetical protein